MPWETFTVAELITRRINLDQAIHERLVDYCDRGQRVRVTATSEKDFRSTGHWYRQTRWVGPVSLKKTKTGIITRVQGVPGRAGAKITVRVIDAEEGYQDQTGPVQSPGDQPQDFHILIGNIVDLNSVK